jgi:Ca2+/H+ antiporter, TMEM165/GDT1 family
MPVDFLVPLATIAVAELLDKSQLSILLLSSRTKNYLQLFLGVMLAFLLIDGSAVLIGTYATTILPQILTKSIAAGLFIIFGILSLRQAKKDQIESISPKNIFLTGFTMVTLAEFGDKTQIATALFATKFHPLLVLTGVLTALGLLTILTILVGQAIVKKVSKPTLNKVAGVLFILLGILFLFV